WIRVSRDGKKKKKKTLSSPQSFHWLSAFLIHTVMVGGETNQARESTYPWCVSPHTYFHNHSNTMYVYICVHVCMSVEGGREGGREGEGKSASAGVCLSDE